MSIASIYLMTTIVRMFLLGTLVPLVALDSTARDIFQSLVGVIDLFGIYYAINQTVGKPTIKVSCFKNLLNFLNIKITRYYRSWSAGACPRVSSPHYWSTGVAHVNTSSRGSILTCRWSKTFSSFNWRRRLFSSGCGRVKVNIGIKF